MYSPIIILLLTTGISLDAVLGKLHVYANIFLCHIGTDNETFRE